MNIETTFRFHTGISHDEEEQPKRFLVPSGDHIKEMTKKKNSKKHRKQHKLCTESSGIIL